MATGKITPMAVMDDGNAGYLDYDSDDYRGCRPEDSDDEEVGVEEPVAGVDANRGFGDVESDLDARMAALRGSVGATNPTPSSTAGPTDGAGPAAEDPMAAPTYYDNDYFDSDDDDDEPAGPADAASGTRAAAPPAGGKRKVVGDEDLFYDPTIDDDNQKWVDNMRKSQYEPFEPEAEAAKSDAERAHATSAASAANQKRGLKAMPMSDAILNCAACMCILSLDCQKHDSYDNQFRAMFVHNCRVIETEDLFFKAGPKKRGYKTKKQRDQENAVTADDQAFHPVKCTECETVVGVYDAEDIYHFFNVLASPP